MTNMFDELKSLKTKLKTEEKESKAKSEEFEKNKKKNELKSMFEDYMKDVKVKK